MPKLVVDELDVSLNKKAVIKLCEDNNIVWLEHTNINGGKYIECIVGYNSDWNQSEYVDIYYKCMINKSLYRPKFTEPKQFYVDLIMDYFKRG